MKIMLQNKTTLEVELNGNNYITKEVDDSIFDNNLDFMMIDDVKYEYVELLNNTKIDGQSWLVFDLSRSPIEVLKERLSGKDYQILKCYEYQLVGKELPYDLEALHIERENIRSEINEYEIIQLKSENSF